MVSINNKNDFVAALFDILGSFFMEYGQSGSNIYLDFFALMAVFNKWQTCSAVVFIEAAFGRVYDKIQYKNQYLH